MGYFHREGRRPGSFRGGADLPSSAWWPAISWGVAPGFDWPAPLALRSPSAGSTRHATTADPPPAERPAHLADLPSALRPPHSVLLRFLLEKAFRVFRVFRGPPSVLRVLRDGSLDPAPIRDGSSPASSGSALRGLCDQIRLLAPLAPLCGQPSAARGAAGPPCRPSSTLRRPDSAPKAVTPPSDRPAPPPPGARAHPPRSPQSALPSAAAGALVGNCSEDSTGRPNRSIDLSRGGGSGRPVISGALGGRSGRISRGPVTRARASIRLGGGARTSVASRAFSECRPGRFSKAARASLSAEWTYLIRRRRDARKTRGRRLAFVK